MKTDTADGEDSQQNDNSSNLINLITLLFAPFVLRYGLPTEVLSPSTREVFAMLFLALASASALGTIVAVVFPDIVENLSSDSSNMPPAALGLSAVVVNFMMVWALDALYILPFI